MRLLPDGRPMELVVETAGEETEQTDVLELVAATSGSRSASRSTPSRPQREVLRNRIFSGETLMSIWYGIDNGMPTADMSPASSRRPASEQLQWPKWGQYYETKGAGRRGAGPAGGERLLELFEAWRAARTTEERREIWDEMLDDLQRARCYTIGLIGGVLQPVAARKTLRNVPEEAIFNWEPGAQFGIYRPDTFWFDS